MEKIEEMWKRYVKDEENACRKTWKKSAEKWIKVKKDTKKITKRYAKIAKKYEEKYAKNIR